MEPTVMHFRVYKIKVIRLQCHHEGCHAVSEMPLENIEATMTKTKGCCPFCGKPFTDPKVDGGANAVVQFAKSILALNELAGQVGIQLPIAKDSE